MDKIDTLGFQGDISFLSVTDMPKDVVLVTQNLASQAREGYGYHPEKGLVLAQGESREHYHAFRDTDAVQLYKAGNDNMYVVLKKPSVLYHEEHKPIEFDAGIYRLFFQYEYTFEDEYKRLAD